MPKLIGVRFHGAGRIYPFAPGPIQVALGDAVVVQSPRGEDLGIVSEVPREVAAEHLPDPLYAVLRIANDQDLAREAANRERERAAYQVAKARILAHGLEMHLVDVEFSFAGDKILFYFTADGRVDFRALVRDLAQIFHTRIELRQIGVRDEARMVGGLGRCGRPLCCTTWLHEFIPVSIKMAKEQSLSMNPAKISGCCGRLMCCLKYENETYEQLRKALPKVGTTVTTAQGRAKVEQLKPLEEKVFCRLIEDPEAPLIELGLDEWQAQRSARNQGESASSEYAQTVPQAVRVASDHPTGDPARADKPCCCQKDPGQSAEVETRLTPPTPRGEALDLAYEAETAPEWLDAEIILEEHTDAPEADETERGDERTQRPDEAGATQTQPSGLTHQPSGRGAQPGRRPRARRPQPAQVQGGAPTQRPTEQGRVQRKDKAQSPRKNGRPSRPTAQRANRPKRPSPLNDSPPPRQSD